VNPAVILIDNKLYSMVKGLDTQVVPEKNVRYKHHRRLILIADNLANYFRILIKDNPKRFKEELRKFEKLK